MTCTLPHWGDARANSPSGSAMEAPALSHRPCWSPIDPAQVSMFSWNSQPSIYSSFPPCPLYVGQIEDILYLHFSISALFCIYSPWPMTHTVGPCLQITKLFLDYFMVFPHGRQIVYACGVTLGKMRRMHGSLQRREVCLNGSIEWLLCPRKFTIILQATTPTKCPHVVFIPWANSLAIAHPGTLLHKTSFAWTMVE